MAVEGWHLLEPLTEGEVERINAASLHILREVGLRVHDDSVLNRLKIAGAMVDETTGNVNVPEAMVTQALETAPRTIMLYHASGREMPCGPGYAYFGTQGYVPKFYDYDTGLWRTPGEEEAAGWAKLADALPGVSTVQPITQDPRIPPLESALRMARAVILNTSKHYLAQPLDISEAQVWFDLSQIVAQGDEARRRGLVTMMATCNSPLQMDEKNTRLLVFAAERDIPVAFFSGPLSGATAPITLAGTLALQNAEILFALVLHQVMKPGAPFMIGTASSSLDLRTGHGIYAPIEYSLMKVATGQFARLYKLPFYAAAAMADSASLDVQNGMEKALAVIITLLSGASFTSGGGNLATGLAAAYEQLVIDHEIFQMAGRFVSGITVTDETLALDVLKRIGVGGHFMMDAHTIAWMRSGEHFLSRVANREGLDGKGMLERAHEIVKDVLANHQPTIPDRTIEAVNEYVVERLS